MSRIGKQPITIPEKVEVKIQNDKVLVKGPLGELEQEIDKEIEVKLKKGMMIVSRKSETKKAKSMHGLTRSLLANMVKGVTEGFTKVLELHGTGYRVKKEGEKIILQVGFSHPVVVEPPKGIEFQVKGEKEITVSGIDKQQVGNLAAQIRSIRKPDVYKGKGIRYQGEVIRKKPGKAAKVGAEGGKYE